MKWREVKGELDRLSQSCDPRSHESGTLDYWNTFIEEKKNLDEEVTIEEVVRYLLESEFFKGQYHCLCEELKKVHQDWVIDDPTW